MYEIILTQDQGFLGPVAYVLGLIMNAIYSGLSAIGINNIGLAIIVLTIIIYTCLLPLTYKQQKFSFISKIMNPELKVIQEKYKGKKDNDSMLAQNNETRALYDKYGVSPSGPCIQLLIQMPILFALYSVLRNVPAYVDKVREVYAPLTTAIMNTDGFRDKMTTLVSESGNIQPVVTDFKVEDTVALGNYVIDALYKLTENGWNALSGLFSGITDIIETVHNEVMGINYFLGLDIGYSPFDIITHSFNEQRYLMMAGAILIPLASYATQVINIKLMPQPEAGGNDQMTGQMKTMNRIMPLFSFVMCFTVPVGLGIYWIASAAVRIVQQIIFNNYFKKIDINDIIEKNKEKAKKKAAKRADYARIYSSANTSTKTNTNISGNLSADEQNEKIAAAREYTSKAKPGSMAARANMVKEFNEKNAKKE